MENGTCRKCGREFEEAKINYLELCAACNRSRLEVKKIKESIRTWKAMAIGSLLMFAFPLALIFKGANEAGYYVNTSRGRTTQLSAGFIAFFIVAFVALAGVSLFNYLKRKQELEMAEDDDINTGIRSGDE